MSKYTFDPEILAAIDEYLQGNCERQPYTILSIKVLYNIRYLVLIQQAAGLRAYVLYGYKTYSRSPLRMDEERVFGHWVTQEDGSLRYLGEGNYDPACYIPIQVQEEHEG